MLLIYRYAVPMVTPIDDGVSAAKVIFDDKFPLALTGVLPPLEYSTV